MDGHGSHYTPELLDFARANNIIILGYPPHCTHALQGLDVVCFARMKDAWKEEINKFEELHKGKVTKADFTEVFGKAFLKAFTKETVLAAFDGKNGRLCLPLVCPSL
jgi:DDE superfamily endonuclease